MKKGKILILGASEEMIPLMKLARKEGLQVLTTDRNHKSKGIPYSDIYLNIDASNIKAVLSVFDEYSPQAILTSSEALLPVVAKVCAQKGLPGMSEEVASISMDKYLFRKKMAEAGIKTPRFCFAQTVYDVRKAIAITDLPAIVKPVDYSGSAGVKRVKTLRQAEAAWENAHKVSPSGRVIIEQFIEGKEVSVETWSQNHKTNIAAITDKKVSDNDHFVELRHTIPSNLSEYEKFFVEQEVQKMASALSLNNCITHTELLITDKCRHPLLIETGARPGGDRIGLTLVEAATAINMSKIMLYLALGEPVPQQKAVKGFAAVQFVTTENLSKIQSKHNALIKDTNFVDHHLLKKDDPGRLTSSADRISFYIFRSKTRESLNNTLKVFDE